MEIIVISIAQYKEKDAIVNAITDGKAFSFFSKGILNPKSKNGFLNCILCKANITLIEGKLKYPILETAELICSPFLLNNTLGYLNSLLLIDEAMIHLFEESERFLAYDAINKSLIALRRNVNPFLASLYFLLKILPLIGFELEVKQCVNCGSKKSITDFSFIDGGFLCSKCSESAQRRYTNNQLLLIRGNVLNDDVSFVPEASDDEIKALLFELNEFITEGLGYHLRNLDSLLK